MVPLLTHMFHQYNLLILATITSCSSKSAISVLIIIVYLKYAPHKVIFFSITFGMHISLQQNQRVKLNIKMVSSYLLTYFAFDCVYLLPLPPPVNCFIIFFISLNCFIKRLTSCNERPEPLAIRFYVIHSMCLDCFFQPASLTG